MRFRDSFAILSVLTSFITVAHALPLISRDGDITQGSNYSTATLDINTFNFFARQLGPKLSHGASIYLQGSEGFKNATNRWQKYNDPHISIAVEVATEKDVSETIILANKFLLPFLAVGGGLGATDSLATLRGGVEIWMRKMNNIEISSDGKSATIGGGVIDIEVVNPLFAKGKQTVTGGGECVGMTGAGLGGGHGFLQGRYGLVADQWIELTVVLADGRIVTASETSNPDLFYAMRGAGHNFGIVTSYRQKIYDVPTDASGKWYYESFIYSNDKVEALFQLINTMMANGTQPKELMNYATYVSIPSFDPHNAVISFVLLYNGDESIGKNYAKPYHSLNPLFVDTGIKPLTDLPQVTSIDLNSQICQRGFSRLKYPVNVQTYDIPTQRKIFEKFNNFVIKTPAFNTSLFLFEGYALEGVQAVPEANTAVPFRNDNIIISSVISYMPNQALDSKALQFGIETRDLALKGSGTKDLHAYVNYAHGDESVEQKYGGAKRVRKLRCLKGKWDPLNRFRFFNPVGVSPYTPGTTC